MNFHRLINRQIKKFLAEVNLQENSNLLNFIQAVSESYQNYENDKYLQQHAFDIADSEYYEITQKLLNEKKLRDQSTNTLLKIIATLENDDSIPQKFDSNDLLVIAEYLEKQVRLRKEAEDKNRELSFISSKTTELILITDAFGKITWVNDAFEKQTEFKFEEVIGKSPGSILHGPETDEETTKRIRKAIRRKESINENIINYSKSGKKYWLNLTISPVFDENKICTNFIAIERDVTEKINNELEIKRLSIQLQSILDNVTGYIFCKDYNGRFLFVNKAVADLFGKSPEEVVGQTDYEYGASQEEIDNYLKMDRKVIDTKTPQFIPEETVLRKDGTRGIFQTTKVPIDFPGIPNGAVLGVSIDITDRKRAELEIKAKNSELAASEEQLMRNLDELLSTQKELRRQQDEIIEVKERFELAVLGSNDGIWDWNLRTNEVYYSPRWKEMLGFKSEEIENKFGQFDSLIHTEDKERVINILSQYLNREIDSYVVELRMRKKDNSYAWILTKGAALFDEAGKPYRMTGSHSDITSQKESELLRQQRQITLERHNRILTKLSTTPLNQYDSLDNALQVISEAAAEGLNIERFGIWDYTGTELICRNLYDTRIHKHQSGDKFVYEDAPVYFNALSSGHTIVAHDILSENLIAEFRESYLIPLNIQSMLGIPVRLNGVICGVLGCEKISKSVVWNEDDLAFSRSISDIISLTIESNKTKLAEENARYKGKLLAAITETTQGLLRSQNWTSTLLSCFETIGELLAVDRVYYYESSKKHVGNRTIIQKIQWIADNSKPKTALIPNFDNMKYLNLKEFFTVIYRKGYYFLTIEKVKDTSLRHYMLLQNIVSVLIYPLFLKGKIKGYIVFEDCTRNRQWTKEEISILQTLTSNVSTAIERKESEDAILASQQQFKSVISNMPGVNYRTINKESKRIFGFINDSVLQLTGYPQSKFLHHPIDVWTDIIVAEDLSATSIENNIQLHTEIPIEYRIVCADGTIKWVEERYKTINDISGNLLFVDGFIMDITSRKNAEIEIIHARELAETASRTKSDFLANMSHEIRTPLNGVIGFADILTKTNLDETQMKYMTTIFQSANTLLSIINDILDFSKIEANKLELSIEKFDLFVLCNQVMEVVSFQVQNKHLEMIQNISPDIPRYIWADEIRLRQILINLLSNAIKFTEKGEVELKVEILEKVGTSQTKILFSVRDTGIGIDAKNQKKVFEVFSQEDLSTTKKYGGTGLGLAISSKLLSLMNSELKLQSEISIGSCFYFEITFDSQMGEAVVWDNIELYKNILIVDDNTNNLTIFQNLLSSNNIKSDTAKSGNEAITLLLGDKQYDAVLMDYNMPEMDGIETIRKIRQKLKMSHDELPIILLYSSMDDEYINKECRELDVRHRLNKPVNMKQLFETLSRLKIDSTTVQPSNNIINHQNDCVLSNDEITMLIAEDQPVNMMLITTIVYSYLPNANIIVAVNGVDAVEKFKQCNPSFVFMDIQMPEMNGYDAAKAIRLLELDGNRVPIVALTAGAVKGEREKCLEAGMDDYITKPVVSDTVRTILANWLGLKTIDYTEEKLKVESNNVNIHFDKNDFISRMGKHATHMLNKLIPIIKRTLPEDIAELYKHYNQKDIEGIKSTAHKIKGGSTSMSLILLSDLAKMLELVNDFNENVILDLIQKMEEEIQIVQVILTEEEKNLPL